MTKNLFVLSLSSHSRIFHSYGDVTIAGEGLQILTYDRHPWPLSSEGSLTSHTYCDTGPHFIMVIAVELSLPVFTTLVCRDRGSNPDLPHARRTLYLYANAAVCVDLSAYLVPTNFTPFLKTQLQVKSLT